MIGKTGTPYEPMAPLREQRVGKFKVKGNDSFATVCRTGLVDAAIEVFDNDPSDTDREPKNATSTDPSAFRRAVAWAEANQSDPRATSLF